MARGKHAVRHGRSRGALARIREAAILVACFGVPALVFPLGGNPFGPPKLSLLLAAATVVCLTLLFDSSARERLALMVRVSWPVRLAFLLAGVAVLSVALAADLREAVFGCFPDYRGLAALFACLAVGIAIVSLDDHAWLRRTFFRAATVLTGLVSLVAIVERAGFGVAVFKTEGAIRTIATAGNASNLGVLLVMLLPLALYGSLRDRQLGWRYAGEIAMLGGVVVLVWTLSRGAWLGAIAAAAVGVAVWGIAHARNAAPGIGRRELAAGAGLVAVVLVVAVVAMPQALSRAATLLDTSSDTAQWRFSTWRSAVEMVGDRPLSGFGPNGFRRAYPAYKEAGQDDGRLGHIPVESPHNATLEAATSLGVPGLLVTLALMVALAQVAIRASRPPTTTEALPLATALVGGFVAVQLHHLTLDTAPLLTAIAALLVLADTSRSSAAAVNAPSSNRLLIALTVGLAASTALLAASTVAAVLVTAADARIPRSSQAAVSIVPWEPAIAQRAARSVASGIGDDTPSDAPAFDIALSHYDAALAIAPNDPYLATEAAHFALRASLLRDDPSLLDFAEETFTHATRLDPRSGMPLAGLGRVQLVRGFDASARELLERSVALSPANRVAWLDLARACTLLGDARCAAAAELAAAELAGSAPNRPRAVR